MDDYERAALDWVNEIRILYGHELLPGLRPGVPRRPKCCVIARSLCDVEPTEVVPHSVYVGEAARFVPPYNVCSFIHAFDDGYYPHLVDGLVLQEVLTPEDELARGA